ncbi:hypothetical protein [Streptomyces sp. NPDC056061]
MVNELSGLDLAPFSEAQFRTTRYAADYPERFDSLAHAGHWMDALISYRG